MGKYLSVIRISSNIKDAKYLVTTTFQGHFGEYTDALYTIKS